MLSRKPLLIARLNTTNGIVHASGVWSRNTYVLRLVGRTTALRALLIEVRPVSTKARKVTFRPDRPITDLATFEPFFDTVSARWRVLKVGPFSDFAPGLPALSMEHPPCPAAQ